MLFIYLGAQAIHLSSQVFFFGDQEILPHNVCLCVQAIDAFISLDPKEVGGDHPWSFKSRIKCIAGSLRQSTGTDGEIRGLESAPGFGTTWMTLEDCR